MIKLSLLLLLTSAPLLCASATDNGPGPVSKKLIGLGWDSPDAETYAAHLSEIEKTPFHGIRIQLAERRIDGQRITLRHLFSGIPWKSEWFENDVKLLKQAKSGQLTENFLSVAGGPGADWFDDEAWKAIVENARIAARIARETGMRGLIFDPEVGQSKPPFTYIRQDHRDRYRFEEYAAQARKRGRETMKAMAEEYPEMTVFTLFMSSGLTLGAFGGDPREGLGERRNYSLYPAFLNGWLDAMPSGMTLVDGAEYSYPHSDEAQYLKHANAVRNSSRAFISTENQQRFGHQVSLALAIYLDAFTNAPLTNTHSDVYNDPPLRPGERLVDRLESAVSSAQFVSDRYVWIWGENYRWWPTASDRVKPQKWSAILPGIETALRRGMDPEAATIARANREFEVAERKYALRGKAMKNVITGGDFPGGRGEAPLPEVWKLTGNATREGGMGYRDYGALRLESGASASIEAEVQPLTYYRLRARVRQMGQGAPVLKLHLTDANATAEATALSATPTADPRDGWQEVALTFRAPAGNDRLSLQLSTEGQKDANDVIWYDDIELFAIAVN